MYPPKYICNSLLSLIHHTLIKNKTFKDAENDSEFPFTFTKWNREITRYTLFLKKLGITIRLTKEGRTYTMDGNSLHSIGTHIIWSIRDPLFTTAFMNPNDIDILALFKRVMRLLSGKDTIQQESFLQELQDVVIKERLYMIL